MNIVCPKCQGPGFLQITAFLDIPPDSRSDEIRIQLFQCRDCGFLGAGAYEESRRGALDSESFDHYGFELDSTDYQRLSQLIRACPHPKTPRCDCPSHKTLNLRNDNGRWIGLESFRLGQYFAVTLD